MDSRSTADKSTLAHVLTLEGHKCSIPSISYFADGKGMISGSGDQTVRRWDLEAEKEIKEARDVCQQKVHTVGVSRNGRWVVSAGGDELRVCEVETGTVRLFKGHRKRISCIDISADSTLLTSGAEDFTVRVWSLETGKLVAGPFKSADEVGTVRFSHDSKKLVVKSWWGNYLEVWDVQSEKLQVKMGKYGGINHIASVPVFWTTKENTIITAFSVYWHPPKTIYEFDASTLETVGAPFEGHTDAITSLALSLDCSLLASASGGHIVKLWAFESRQLLASFHVPCPLTIILSPDSRQLAYTTWLDNKIHLCNIPPDVLASIRLAQQSHSALTSRPRHLSLADLLNPDKKPRFAAMHCKPTMDRAPTASPCRLARPTSICGEWTHGEPAPDLLRTLSPPVIPLPLPPRRLSPTIASRLSHSPRLLRSFSITGATLPVRNQESCDFLPEAMLQNLTEYVTKDDNYPAARGGFGEIWKCTYLNDRRPIKVAVKTLQVYTTDQTGEAKKKKNNRIKRELRICAKLKHTNVLPVYGYTAGFGPFIAIVSPWAENGDLTAYLELEGATLTLVRRFQMLRDIIAGLQYLHANNVIHGDFNGPNVLINGDGTACIADFGLSLMYSEVISASRASWTSNLKGNVRWMAPELLVLEREDGSPTRPSEQSDIFSFGGIMLQVLTNKIPYYYLPNDPAIILAMHKSEKPSRSRYPVLLEKHWQFIEQCWSTDPRDRPSTERADDVIRNEFYSLSRSR